MALTFEQRVPGRDYYYPVCCNKIVTPRGHMAICGICHHLYRTELLARTMLAIKAGTINPTPLSTSQEGGLTGPAD